MRASVSNFRRALLLAALLTASVAAAETRQAETAPAPRPLDRREHYGYESWERLLPTHVKAQYAGGMGFLSAGYGWDYGRKCRWETDMMIGVLPKAYSDRTHMTFTLKQNVFSTTVCPDPWKNECKFGAILFRAAERGAGPYASERSPPSDKCGPDLSNRVPAISARTIFLF